MDQAVSASCRPCGLQSSMIRAENNCYFEEKKKGECKHEVEVNFLNLYCITISRYVQNLAEKFASM